MSKKIVTDSEGNSLSWGDWVAFETAPLTLLSGLPMEDQEAIQAQAGKPVCVERFNADGQVELEFGEKYNSFRTIWLEPRYLVKVKFTQEALLTTGTRQSKREKLWRENTVAAWITVSQSERGSFEYESNFWSSMLMFSFVSDRPEEAWILIDAIRHATDNSGSLAMLAAGHLEDLLVQHGDKFIDRFEVLAKSDESFARLLGGVWQNDMTEEVWSRVRKIALPSN